MYKYFFIAIFLFAASELFSQDVKIDTLNNPKDSISIKTDSLTAIKDTIPKAKTDIDEIINYNANDSVVFDMKSRKMFLYNNGELTYKDLKLNAGIIIFEQQTQMLRSTGLPDTSDITKLIQTPLMYQGSDKYEGSILAYNFKTKQGSISMGYSEADVGYYLGEKIKKVTPDVFFIKNGLYTTSTDRINPEYYFYSPKMKIIPKNKVLGESVFLYIEGVPVFWIPFVILPDKHGRSSGLITPTYGNDGTYGSYFSNFGYFWATNDYMDFTFKASVFSKGRLDFNTRFRYALKYNFSGSFEGGYTRIRTGEQTDLDKYSSDQWVINILHNQKINPTTSLDANLSFISGKSYYNNSTNNLNELLRQNAVSNLTFSKFWEETPYSLYVNYYRDQNLTNGDVTEKLPSMTFTRSESYPFRSANSDPKNMKLYEYLSYSYSGQFINNRVKRTVPDHLGIDSTYNDRRSGIMHTLNFSFSPPSEYINIRPYFNYSEIWYEKFITRSYDFQDSTLKVFDNNRFNAVRYFSTGVSLNTKFIGIFRPNIFKITGIRHTISPSVSYVYRPDFSADKWGYYTNYMNQFGQQVKYSYYEKEVFGTAPMGESQSLVFSVGNIFEMKTKQTDTSENKFQLINFNLATSYNFAADSLKWSDLRADFRTQIGSILNIGGGATFNFYEYDNSVGVRVNRYLLSSQGRIADLTSFNINLSTGFSHTFTNSLVPIIPVDTSTNSKSDTVKKKIEQPIKVENKNINEIIFNIPVSGSLNYNYSVSKFTPTQVFKTSNISGNLSFGLSDKWKFSFATSYDFITKQLSAPYITAYRDLKSWEINFNWYPLGAYKGFFLQIRIKAPQLNDIKLTKQTNARGVY